MQIKSMMLLCIALGLALPASAPAADADPAPVLESVVLMRVQGKVVVDPSGGLAEMTLDTALDPALKLALEAAARRWTFKPVMIDGVARRAVSSVNIVLAATKEDDLFRVGIDSVSFPDAGIAGSVADDEQPEPIRPGSLAPPRFPMEQLQARAMGTVLLGIRVTAEGRVGDAVAIQSMVFDRGKGRSGPAKRHMRRFEAAAIEAVRSWTFIVPADAATRTPAQMTVVVPVQFNLGYDLDTSGRWLPVLRRDKQAMPWLPASEPSRRIGVAEVAGSKPVPLAGLLELTGNVAGTPLL